MLIDNEYNGSITLAITPYNFNGEGYVVNQKLFDYKLIMDGSGNEPPNIETLKQDSYAFGNGAGKEENIEAGSFDTFAIILVAAFFVTRRRK
ncbi:MAG: hypothetical protein HRT38_10590 [Alteromonadaceae bacterium]|nr:hypothetical protein [Alteromonadaceae bacterium]